MSTLERWAWGRGAVDAAPPVSSEAATRRTRELGLRLLHEALSDERLGPCLWRHASGDDAHARLTRLLTLLRDLVATELPRLLRCIRCETVDRPRVMREPAGGRIDGVASVRRAVASRGCDAADAWVLVRRERLVDTPVNRLVAAQLRDVERRLSPARQRESSALQLMDGERTVVGRARGVLARFLDASPLSALELPHRSIERLRADARLRRDEYGRVAGFDTWWRALDAAWLDALRVDDLALDGNGCYELCVGLGLALALRRRMAAQPDRGDGVLRFREGAVEVEIHFGRRMEGALYGRPATATLVVSRGGPPRRVVVEARNQRSDVAGDAAHRMHLWLASQRDADALLLTPEPSLAEHPGDAFRWRAFLEELTQATPCDPVEAWRPLLDELLTPDSQP